MMILNIICFVVPIIWIMVLVLYLLNASKNAKLFHAYEVFDLICTMIPAIILLHCGFMLYKG